MTKSDSVVFSVFAAAWLIVYLLFSDQIWEALWFMAIPAELSAVYFFLAVSIFSIFFWINKYHKFRQAYIPFLICLITIVAVCSFRLHKKLKLNYIGSQWNNPTMSKENRIV